jgi:hypothetical protein
MCGHKKKNTGSATKNDPNSRVNKALRRWRCKCSEELTEKLAGIYKSIYKAPRHVRDAFFSDPEKHRRLSQAGGRAPKAKKKITAPKTLKQTNFDEALDAASHEEGLKMFQEGKDRIKRAELSNQLKALVEQYERTQAAGKSRGFGDPHMHDYTLDNRHASGILREIKDTQNSKLLRGANALGGGLFGGFGGAFLGSLYKKPHLGAGVGGVIGGAGGAVLADKVRSGGYKDFDGLSREEKIQELKSYLKKRKDKKNGKLHKAVKEYDKVQTLMAPAGLATGVGTIAAGSVLGAAASALPELGDKDLKKLVSSSKLNGAVKINKPENAVSLGGRNAWFRENDAPLTVGKKKMLGSIEATGRDMWKPGIVSHELGHANIHGSKGLTGFLQRKLYSPTMKMNAMLGGLPASAATYAMTKDEDDTTRGALKGLGVGALMNAGVLVPEFEASRRGIMSMLKTNLSKRQKVTNSLSLAPAFLTYLLSTAGVGAGVGALNAHWNKKSKEKKQKALKKTAKSKILKDLLEAKELSDKRDFVHKNELLRKLVTEHPKQFKVDSHLNSAYVGLTHKPTGFKIHAQKKIIPSELLT